MGFGGNMQKMMKQAQKMQQDMARVQEELKTKQVTGTAGGGMVKVTMTCSSVPVAVEINPEVVDADDVEMLQDLVLAAMNDAMGKAADVAEEDMKKVTGGLDLGKLGLR